MTPKGKPAVGIDAIGGDRRQDRRYHLRMGLFWKLIRRRRVLDAGIGHTIDISGGGILFDPGRPLPKGHDVELSISWPVLLDGVLAMQLVAKGRIVRDNCGQVAIQTAQRELVPVPTPIDIQLYAAKLRKPNQTTSESGDPTICSLKSCAVARVFTHKEPVDFGAVLPDHSGALSSEFLTALLQRGVDGSSGLDAIVFGDPRTHDAPGVIREVVSPRFMVHS